jgi:hypothetical protein
MKAVISWATIAALFGYAMYSTAHDPAPNGLRGGVAIR